MNPVTRWLVGQVEMIKQEKSKFKPSWEFFALGVGFVIMGIVMIVQGISAQKTGAIIPATGKSGPMTGIESIVTGVVATIAGLPFIAYEVYKMYKRKSDN